MKQETIQQGLMIVKDGLGWGLQYDDGHSKAYGWVDITKAGIHDPEYLITPEDATYKGSHYEKELKTGKLVKATRTTTTEIHEFTVLEGQ